MKREEVKGILPDVTDEQLTKIMDLHGADIERQKQAIATLTLSLIHICAVCGKMVSPFVAQKSKEANNGVVYCSGTCRKAANNG